MRRSRNRRRIRKRRCRKACPVDGAYDLLDYLKEKYSLYIVSNGFRHVQESRLKIGNFNSYFSDIFVSEDIEIAKPAAGFLDYCFKKIGSPDKKEVVLIGDSLTADIKGGFDYGIDTIWFNKNNEANQSEITPTHTVPSLEVIKKIL